MARGVPYYESSNRMTRRRKLLLGIFALVLCGVLAVMFWPEKPEPVYKGRKLSEWVVEIAHTNYPGDWPSGTEARQALEAIGTNGVPFYLHWMTFRPSILRKAMYQLAATTRPWVKCQFSPTNDKKIDRAVGAGFALELLGPRAAATIPYIISDSASLDEYWGYRLGGTHTMRILNCITPREVSWVLRFMTNGNALVRAEGIRMAWTFVDPSVVNQIRICLHDPDERVRAAATNYMQVLNVGVVHPSDKP
jgi:hypothetical protein